MATYRNPRTIFALAITLASTVFAYRDLKAGDVRVYVTRGTAVIYASGTLASQIEKSDIPIPGTISTADPNWSDLYSDVNSGWTKCRLPLKTEWGLTGPWQRSLVFECMRIS